MKADLSAQQRLLDLQALDTATAQREHRRRTLPELAVIAATEARLARLRDDAVLVRTRLSDLDGHQRRLELDVEQVRARSDRDRRRLDSGATSNSKELERLQHEVSSLARRQGDLEEQVLELMEQREGIDGELAQVEGPRPRSRPSTTPPCSVATPPTSRSTRTWAPRRADREALLPELPPDLVTLYERVRSKGGSGAAALRQRRCEGCRMELARTALNKVRDAPPDEVLRCEECGRILVRTPESGL